MTKLTKKKTQIPCAWYFKSLLNVSKKYIYSWFINFTFEFNRSVLFIGVEWIWLTFYQKYWISDILATILHSTEKWKQKIDSKKEHNSNKWNMNIDDDDNSMKMCMFIAIELIDSYNWNAKKIHIFVNLFVRRNIKTNNET